MIYLFAASTSICIPPYLFLDFKVWKSPSFALSVMKILLNIWKPTMWNFFSQLTQKMCAMHFREVCPSFLLLPFLPEIFTFLIFCCHLPGYVLRWMLLLHYTLSQILQGPSWENPLCSSKIKPTRNNISSVLAFQLWHSVNYLYQVICSINTEGSKWC